MSTYHNTAIVLGDLKDALLHFEYVVPMNISGFALDFVQRLPMRVPLLNGSKN
jgi:hypothetical protein